MAKPRSLEIYQTEFVQQHLRRASDVLASSWQGLMNATVPWKPFESPLEAAFYVWFEMVSTANGSPLMGMVLVPQAEVTIGGERFRLDFAVEPAGVAEADNPYPLKVAVELDGHDFHERTREQVERRNYRDRALASDGWQVLHFSGSEFNRSPIACITATFEAVRRATGKS